MDKETTLNLYREIGEVFDKYECDRIKMMATCWHLLEMGYTEWMAENPKKREFIMFEFECHKDMVLQTMLGKKWKNESPTDILLSYAKRQEDMGR